MTISIPLWIIAAGTVLSGFTLVALAIVGALFLLTLRKGLHL